MEIRITGGKDKIQCIVIIAHYSKLSPDVCQLDFVDLNPLTSKDVNLRFYEMLLREYY